MVVSKVRKTSGLCPHRRAVGSEKPPPCDDPICTVSAIVRPTNEVGCVGNAVLGWEGPIDAIMLFTVCIEIHSSEICPCGKVCVDAGEVVATKMGDTASPGVGETVEPSPTASTVPVDKTGDCPGSGRHSPFDS